jgi:UDP-N-acetylglucosamine 3-dehydrogenase
LRIAVVGLGSMGRNHYRILRSQPDVELVAVCDPHLEESYPERMYGDVEQLLREEELDAAIVSVPTVLHREIAVKIADHGVGLLVEKPVAPTISDALEIKAAVEANDVAAAVGHVERFNPVVTSLLRELKDKEIYSISITRVGPFPPRIKDVGVLVDLSVHDIDLVHLISRGAEVLESRVFKSVKAAGEHEDNAVITMRLENDTVATIITNWLTPFKKRMIEVATGTAYYEADLISQMLHEYSEYKTNNSFRVRECPVQVNEPLENEIVAFVRYLSGGDRGCLATIDDGIRTLKLIHKRRAQSI